VQPGDAHELLLGSGVRKDDCVILVLARERDTLWLQGRDHLAWKVLHADHLADRVLDAKELIADGPPQDTHTRRTLPLIRGEDRSLINDPTPDLEELGRHPSERRIPVLIPVNDLDRSIHVGGHALDEGNLILDRDGIGEHQALRPTGSGADPVHGAAPSLDPDEVVPEVPELLLDTRLAGLADRHNADDRGDADGDAE